MTTVPIAFLPMAVRETVESLFSSMTLPPFLASSITNALAVMTDRQTLLFGDTIVKLKAAITDKNETEVQDYLSTNFPMARAIVARMKVDEVRAFRDKLIEAGTRLEALL